MLSGLVMEELSIRPRMNERDLAKLLYQAALGGDHLLKDREAFLHGLREEWASLRRRACWTEPPLQLISPHGDVWRVHLSPLQRIDIPRERLFGLLARQPLRQGRRAGYRRLLEEAVELAARGSIPFDADRLDQYRRHRGPVHHSRSYGQCSYRVVNDPGTAVSIVRLLSG